MSTPKYRFPMILSWRRVSPYQPFVEFPSSLYALATSITQEKRNQTSHGKIPNLAAVILYMSWNGGNAPKAIFTF